MSNITINDFIIPTNPIAALLFGVIFTMIVVVIVYVETKEFKVSLYTFLITVAFVLFTVWLLDQFGFYE